MKQTAVEWLFLMLNNPNRDQEFANKLLLKALEMEKQQIMDAFNSGENSDDYFFPSLKLKECEVYYNETYKSKQDEI
jgi:hypothetical protein